MQRLGWVRTLALMSMAGSMSACASMPKSNPWAGSLIIGGFTAFGVGTVMTAEGGDLAPRVLPIYRPGEEPPGWDPSGRLSDPALLASGLVMAGLGLASIIVGAAMIEPDESPERDADASVITAGLSDGFPPR